VRSGKISMVRCRSRSTKMVPQRRPLRHDQSRPDPFQRIVVDFADAIPILIACPFPATRPMADRPMGAPSCGQVVICPPLVGVDGRVRPSMRLDKGLQGGPITVAADPSADLAALTPDHASARHAIRLPGAVPARLIRAPARWIGRVAVRAAFLACVLVQFIGLRDLIRERSRGGKAAVLQSLGSGAGAPTHAHDHCPIPQPDAWSGRLGQCRARSARWSSRGSAS
jgi:hypothetical protein